MLYLVSLLAFFTSVLLAFYVYLRGTHILLNRIFFVMCILDGFASFFFYELRSAESIESAWFWIRFLSFWPFILATGAHFIVVYTRRQKLIKSKLFYVALYLPAALLMYVEVATKYYTPELYESSFGWNYTISEHWIAQAANIWVLFISLSMILMSLEYFIKAKDYVLQKQSLFIFLALFFVILITLITDLAFPVFGIEFPEFSDVGSAIANLMIAVAIVKYELFQLDFKKVSQSIVNSIPSAIILTDEHQKIVYANDAAKRTLKTANTEIVGIEASDCIGNIDFVAQSKILGFQEKEILNYKGLKSQVLISVDEYKDKFDILRGYTIVVHDISKMKQMELEKKNAEEADNLKTAFLANMSHEIRTPLNNILGFADIIQRKNKPQEKQQEFIQLIADNGKQLSHIINEIIDISKIESRKLKAERNKVRINELLDTLHSNYKENKIVKEKNLRILNNNYLRKEKSVVFSDGGKLNQILTNLIDNSIKFTESGSIEFGYTLLHDKKTLEFYVKDTGIGISENDYDDIFNRFSQAHEKIVKKSGGAGLGLSITKGLVELIGGNIYLESKKGIGTTFYFTLPYDPVLISTSDTKKCFEPIGKIDKKILLVEDNESTALYMKEILEDINAEVVHAKNGEEALRLYVKGKFDIVLMDIQLPDISGSEVIHKIKESDDTTPFFAVTAYAMSDERDRFITQGFNEYLSKPLREDQLFSLMNKYLN